MSKLHIHIHRARRAGKTIDAGFNESDHKRDSGGKFATSSGNAAHHEGKYQEHMAAAKQKGEGHADHLHHLNAAREHQSAATALKRAQNVQGTQHEYTAKLHVQNAEEAASMAKASEAKVRSGSGASVKHQAEPSFNPKNDDTPHRGREHHNAMVRKHEAAIAGTKNKFIQGAHREAIDMHKAARTASGSEEANAMSAQLGIHPNSATPTTSKRDFSRKTDDLAVPSTGTSTRGAKPAAAAKPKQEGGKSPDLATPTKKLGENTGVVPNKNDL